MDINLDFEEDFEEDTEYKFNLLNSTYENEIEDFLKFSKVLKALDNQIYKLSEEEVIIVISEFQSNNYNYSECVKIWEKHKLSPFDKGYVHKLNVNNESFNVILSIIPQSSEERNIYLKYASEWVRKKLINEGGVNIKSYDEYKYFYNNKIDKDLIFIKNEIDRTQKHLNTIINENQLNEKIIEYSEHYNNNTIDISFFELQNLHCIESIYGLVIGIGMVLSDFEYLSFLKNEIPKYKLFDKYVLKNDCTYLTHFSDVKLDEIRQKLIDNKFIEFIETDDFIKIFREKKLTPKIKSIVWIKKHKRWHSIFTLIHQLVNPNYSDVEQYKKTLNFCFNFNDKINIKEDIEKSFKKSFEEFNKGQKNVKEICDIVNPK